MSWFSEFLNETAGQWFAEAEGHESDARQALARGDFLAEARARGQAQAYRRMGRTFRRLQPDLTPTEEHDWDCTIADLVDLTVGEVLQ